MRLKEMMEVHESCRESMGETRIAKDWKEWRDYVANLTRDSK